PLERQNPMSSTPQIAERIVELVRQETSQKILGTRLADALRTYTHFDPAVHGRLGMFIATHVPIVRRLERNGGDWYYGIVDADHASTDDAPVTSVADMAVASPTR